MTGLLRFVQTLELYLKGDGEPSEDFNQGWTELIQIGPSGCPMEGQGGDYCGIPSETENMRAHSGSRKMMGWIQKDFGTD